MIAAGSSSKVEDHTGIPLCRRLVRVVGGRAKLHPSCTWKTSICLVRDDLRRGLTDVGYCAPGIDRQVVLCRPPQGSVILWPGQSMSMIHTYHHGRSMNFSSRLPAFVVYVGANERGFLKERSCAVEAARENAWFLVPSPLFRIRTS